jgi:tetratricopeptide (TPR) repeat protein
VRALLAEGRLERVGEQYQPVGELKTLSVPESLRSLVASRLDAIQADDRALLQTASVLGHVFAVSTLSAVTGQEASELERRLRGLVRRELVDLETDPASPERGQFKFMQSLIREVAYGTMGRRERRAQHLAVARHFEAVGDDELAGALASHYLAAHAASDEGPESDAVAAQARLALRGAAERAAALGAHAQAVAHLEQALSVTSDKREHADLLLAAAASAGMAAVEDATDYAATAVDVYRELGDMVGAARASALHGRLLLDASRLDAAADVLEAALASVPEGSSEIEAELAANLARAYMRLVRPAEAVAIADRALAIAERYDLEDVVAEAFVNKGAALGMLGRKREAMVLTEGAVRLAQAGSSASLEIRARHNLAVQLIDIDPRDAREQLALTLELARRVGDRGIYGWVAGTLAAQSLAAGEEVDAWAATLRQILDSAGIKMDRGRPRAILGLIEAARGEHLDEIVADLEEIYGDTADPEELFYKELPRAAILLSKKEFDAAYRVAMSIADLETQGPEFPLEVAMRAAIGERSPDHARDVLGRIVALPTTGAVTRALVARGRGAVAALEGRRDAALAAFREVRDELRRLEQWFDFGVSATDAVSLLPDEPEIVAWAAEARPILERVRAAPELARLDEALGSVAGTMPAAAVGDPAGAPAR